MRKILLIFLVIIFSKFSYAEEVYNYSENIIHGPFNSKIYENSRIYFSKPKNKDNKTFLILEKGQAKKSPLEVIIDTYETEGSPPKIESAFFYPIKKTVNLIVILSWSVNSRGIGTYGNLYETRFYKDEGGCLKRNLDFQALKETTGFDGYQEGEEVSFNLKTASAVKKFINENISK
ncbi:MULTISPECIES: hypothetical protein [unclassified Pseudomonas]|uniref:hypothetical protein n=1 Tax=unclassified Pseudomonas TaxID=196821 RepID=UPI00257C0E88|nr:MULTISPECIES: hypothetical protein [unclassified Pseudomonas]